MTTDPAEQVYRINAGARESPVVLHVPHSSRNLTTPARSGILLDDGALAAELDHLTDARTELIATRAAHRATPRPWLFVNMYSRLVVDPERFPDEREVMRAVGMGAVYTRTSHGDVLRSLDPDHEEQLLATHYRPYAEGMTTLVDEALARTGRAVIIDVHSYPSVALPYELSARAPRPAICLGTDATHTPPWLRETAAAAFAPCGGAALNTPFAGCYVPLRHYGTDRRVSAIMVEIRRDVYLDESTGTPTAGLDTVIGGLTTLIDAIATTSAR